MRDQASGYKECDRDGQIIPISAEGREIKRQRAGRLAERLREMGINLDEV